MAATDDDRGLAAGLARLVVRARWLVVALWIGAAVACHLLLPSLTEVEGSLGLPIADDAPALVTEARSAERFGVPLVSRTQVVQRDPDGLGPGVRQRSEALARTVSTGGRPGLGILAAVPVSNVDGAFPGSRERGTTIVTSLYLPPEVSFGTRAERAERYADELPAGDAVVGVTGSAPAREAQTELIGQRLPLVVAITVAVILAVVALSLRGLGAPLVVLVTIAVAYVVNLGASGWVAEATGLAITPDVEPVVTALLLGVATDYALFFMFQMRTRLAAGEQRREAARRTATVYGPIVVAAGITVAAGTAALLAAQIDFYRAFGPALAVTALVSMVVAATLVPALLAIGGRGVFWPGAPAPAATHAGASPGERARHAAQDARTRAVRLLTRPWIALPVALVVTAGLVVAASGLRDTDLRFDLVASLPGDDPVPRAAGAAEDGFAAGILGPTVLLLEGEGIAASATNLGRLGEELGDQPAVAGVVGPSTPTPIPVGDLFRAPDGDAARYLILFRERPTAQATIDALTRIESRLPALLGRAGLDPERVGVAGDTAIARATVDQTESALLRVGAAALVANLLVLVLFLRSLLAPLVLLATSVLSVGAALGIATYLFQVLLGEPGLVYYVPFAAGVLLVALGSDYNVFLVGGIWREADRRGLQAAIVAVAPGASRPITVAGLVLALSFALLALVPLDALRQFAVVMALGVMIDAVLVRVLLVPALITLMGRAGRWPRSTAAVPTGAG